MEIDLNEILLSGTINNIKDDNKEFIKFGLTSLKYDKRKVCSSLNINRNLYNKYKDFFVIGKRIFIKGYQNSYSINNNICNFITVLDIAGSKEELLNGKTGPHIRYDPDGVMVWNGKRCEAQPCDFNNPEDVKQYNELVSMLKEFE